MDGVCDRNPGIDLDVYVDDIQAGAAADVAGSEHRVAKAVADAAADIRETIEDEIGADVVSDKTALVVSSE